MAAQNAHDFAAVRTLLLDSPQFLWLSNSLSIPGVELAIRRMASFHESEIRRIEPDDARAVAVEVNAETAYLHLPLTFVIGAMDPGPDR